MACVDRAMNSSPGMHCSLTHGDEQLLARLVLPAIAHGERKSLADIVELHLIDQLHVRREAHDEVGRERVDVQEPGRKVDMGVGVARNDLEPGAEADIGSEIDP